MDKAGKRLAHNNVRPDEDLVKHHYNRRGLVGPQSMLFRKSPSDVVEAGQWQLSDLGA